MASVPGLRIQGSKTEKSAGGMVTYLVNGRDEASGAGRSPSRRTPTAW